jgi:hypothetical protein
VQGQKCTTVVLTEPFARVHRPQRSQRRAVCSARVLYTLFDCGPLNFPRSFTFIG